MSEQEQLQKKPLSPLVQNQNSSQFLQKRPFAPQPKSTGSDIQRTANKTSVIGHSFGNLTVQPKLTIGEPGDKYEQEADTVASEVVQRINSSEAVSLKEVSEEEELQMKPLVDKSTSTTSQQPVVQRTIKHAAELANIYNPERKDEPDKNYEADWNSLKQAKGDFLAYEWKRIHAAMKLDENGKPQLWDASDNKVDESPLNEEEQNKLDEKLQVLQQHPTHLAFLQYLENQVSQRLGAGGVAQFYKGAHIIFKDGAAVYDALFQLAGPLAANAGQNPQQPNDVMDKNTGAGTAGQGTKDSLNYWGPKWTDPVTDSSLSKQELDAGKMFKRRPEHNETSHYKKPEEIKQSDPDRPQLGLDLPVTVKGHILFGVVPDGQNGFNTFVQTEGAGFQNLEEHIWKHGKGAGSNWWSGLQTGLVGTTTHGEKTKGGSTAIREEDQFNRDWDWKFLYESAIEDRWGQNDGY